MEDEALKRLLGELKKDERDQCVLGTRSVSGCFVRCRTLCEKVTGDISSSWTPEEVKRLIRLRKEGKTYRMIAPMLGNHTMDQYTYRLRLLHRETRTKNLKPKTNVTELAEPERFDD